MARSAIRDRGVKKDPSRVLPYEAPKGVDAEYDPEQDMGTMIALMALIAAGITILMKSILIGWFSIILAVMSITSGRSSSEGSGSVSTITFAGMATMIAYNQKYVLNPMNAAT